MGLKRFSLRMSRLFDRNAHHQVEHHKHKLPFWVPPHQQALSRFFALHFPANAMQPLPAGRDLEFDSFCFSRPPLCHPITPDVLAHEDSQICRVPRRRSKHCSMFHHVDDSRKRHDDRRSRVCLRLMVPGSKADNCCDDADVFSFSERQFRVGSNFFGGRERRLELPDFSARATLRKCRRLLPVERTLVS